MTRHLILMRHAKSSWDHQGPDNARPLNGRGRRSARALGDWLRATGYLPDEVLCSDALRARETCAGLDLACAVTLVPELYHASPRTMLEVLHEASGAQVLMIGHNPGIAAMASELVATPPAHERFDTYPTGATLVVGFAGPDWSDMRPGSGTVVDFVIPRELPGA